MPRFDADLPVLWTAASGSDAETILLTAAYRTAAYRTADNCERLDHPSLVLAWHDLQAGYGERGQGGRLATPFEGSFR